MGNQLSHCGNAQACFDVNDTRMEIRDTVEAPEEALPVALAHGSGRQPHREDRGAGPSRAAPSGPVGRNHSVQRTFGSSGHGTPRGIGGLSEADRMLGELRNMYASSSGPNTVFPVSICVSHTLVNSVL